MPSKDKTPARRPRANARTAERQEATIVYVDGKTVGLNLTGAVVEQEGPTKGKLVPEKTISLRGSNVSVDGVRAAPGSLVNGDKITVRSDLRDGETLADVKVLRNQDLGQDLTRAEQKRDQAKAEYDKAEAEFAALSRQATATPTGGDGAIGESAPDYPGGGGPNPSGSHEARQAEEEGTGGEGAGAATDETDDEPTARRTPRRKAH